MPVRLHMTARLHNDMLLFLSHTNDIDLYKNCPLTQLKCKPKGAFFCARLPTSAFHRNEYRAINRWREVDNLFLNPIQLVPCCTPYSDAISRGPYLPGGALFFSLRPLIWSEPVLTAYPFIPVLAFMPLELSFFILLFLSLVIFCITVDDMTCEVTNFTT